MKRMHPLIYNLEDYTQCLEKIYNPDVIKSQSNYSDLQENFLDIMNSSHPYDFEKSPQLPRNFNSQENHFRSRAIFSFSAKAREERARRMGRDKKGNLNFIVQKMNEELSFMLSNHREVLSILIDSQPSIENFRNRDTGLQLYRNNSKNIARRNEMTKHFASVLI
ncbi:unnamed protein product [Blepharisma stoltei]|uniref:Uncharacterized protein n=1 Tax=Blepharisma stoltei TaxID=1481888 RepID=A0AAU9JYT9_9CILI|nr:unnamed protein product [Blepharisma stoltei]